MRLAILGLGLMGGSLGLSLGEGWEVVGWDRDAEAIAQALTRGAIGRGAASAAEAVADAQLVCLAVPVLAVPELLTAIAPHLGADAVVTDLASTKAQVCAWAAEALPRTPFVGGHPMAGSERSGIAHARGDLLAGATYVLTPAATSTPEALARVVHLARAAGARVHVMPPEAHDADVALVSHLPFLLSTALAAIAGDDARWPAASRLAASGFRDVSRLASGDVAMHRDICLSNAAAIAPRLREASRLLADLAERLEDAEGLTRFFAEARRVRDAWLAARYNEAVAPPDA